MFNTLKELKESLLPEELLKYSLELQGKSSEELKAILKAHDIEISDVVANECYERLNTVKTMSDEELENVTGGCSSTYSSETYGSLGVFPSYRYNQVSGNHPLITTWLNSCKLVSGGSTCFGCDYMCEVMSNPATYCLARSKECDLGK